MIIVEIVCQKCSNIVSVIWAESDRALKCPSCNKNIYNQVKERVNE